MSKLVFLIVLLIMASLAPAQTMTVITTLINGQKDTLQFGFVQNATQDEDAFLGEENLFSAPVEGYEGRILQRDENNFSCAMTLDYDSVYYPSNFDSKINYRDIADTSLQNRFFELWYSDNETYSIEARCDIPLKSFIYEAYLFTRDCQGDPPPLPGILAINNDTSTQMQGTLIPGLGIRQFIVITNPNLLVTAMDEEPDVQHQADIKLYPNPTSDNFSVHGANLQAIDEILITDLFGNVIQHYDFFPGENSFELDQRRHGIYMIIIIFKNGDRMIKKLVHYSNH